MNRGFWKTLAFTNMDFNFTCKEPSFTTKKEAAACLGKHFPEFGFSLSPVFAFQGLVWLSCRYPIIHLFFAYHPLVIHLKERKRRENERKTTLILVLLNFKRNLFGSCMGLVRDLLFSKWSCSGLVRVLKGNGK